MRKEFQNFSERICVDTSDLDERIPNINLIGPEYKFLVSEPFLLEKKSFVIAFPIDKYGNALKEPTILLEKRFI